LQVSVLRIMHPNKKAYTKKSINGRGGAIKDRGGGIRRWGETSGGEGNLTSCKKTQNDKKKGSGLGLPT